MIISWLAVAAVGFGPGFVATPSGAFCDKECFSQGLTASQFKKIGTQLSTFACGVSDPQLGTVSGYQLSNGTATCSVASATAAKAATDYSCLCQVGDLPSVYSARTHLGLQASIPLSLSNIRRQILELPSPFFSKTLFGQGCGHMFRSHPSFLLFLLGNCRSRFLLALDFQASVSYVCSKDLEVRSQDIFCACRHRPTSKAPQLIQQNARLTEYTTSLFHSSFSEHSCLSCRRRQTLNQDWGLSMAYKQKL
jgi:hypothetical protein